VTTIITFQIPKTDTGFDGTAFTIRPGSAVPAVPAGTTIDATSQTTVTGNTNPSGPEIVLNGYRLGTPGAPGLVLNEANCTIRGLVINGFGQQGILISGAQATGNVISGCYIGTNATGTVAIPNSLSGIELKAGAHGNTIGGVTEADRNVISGNSGCGIKITDPGSDSNVVIGNVVGVNAAGAATLANALQGIAIQNSAQSNTIGGSALGAGNRIWTNGQEGIAVSDATTIRNKLSQNSIFNNAARGIMLYGNANGQQSFPVLTSAKLGNSDNNAGGIDIAGTLNSTPNTTFVIEFFANTTADPSGYGQGQTFIGSTSVVTDSSGSKNFTAQLGAAVPAGQFITAKTTAPDGNTSSYSAVRLVTSADADKDGMPDKYEHAHGLNPNNAADANLDSDGDGMTNLQEYLAGTDPKSAASRFTVSSLDVSSGLPRVGFQSVAGKTYRVEYTDDIVHGPWNVLESGIYTATATLVRITDARGAGLASRFYRVVVEL
jgi:Bacterial TSP3 repeat